MLVLQCELNELWFHLSLSLVVSMSISSVSELKEFLNGNSCSHRCFSVSRFPATLVLGVILRFLLEVTTFQLSFWWISSLLILFSSLFFDVSISISFIAEHS